MVDGTWKLIGMLGTSLEFELLNSDSDVDFIWILI